MAPKRALLLLLEFQDAMHPCRLYAYQTCCGFCAFPGICHAGGSCPYKLTMRPWMLTCQHADPSAFLLQLQYEQGVEPQGL